VAGTSQTAGPLDHRSVDWSRVRRVVYQVRQHYRYSYTDAIWDLKQQLMMIPPDCHHDQRLLEHRLELRGVAGATALHWERDRFGNRVGCVRAEQVPRAVDFEAHYRVERRRAGPEPPCAPAALTGWDTAAYLELTALTAPDRRLEAVARELGAGSADRRALAERAHDWAAGAIGYQAGLTGVQTPAAMALHLGRGVCQDYAHLMLAVLRLLGIPARYVSGHLLGEGAPHAWVEALVESASGSGQEVVAYDPTHHRRAGLSYITVAVGRDFADITPTSGFFSGPATGRLHWSKQAEVVEVELSPAGTPAESAA
jgi:transglutaminase-like putative cysteine protease